VGEVFICDRLAVLDKVPCGHSNRVVVYRVLAAPADTDDHARRPGHDRQTRGARQQRCKPSRHVERGLLGMPPYKPLQVGLPAATNPSG